MLESGFPSKTFSGVRFALVGFSSVDGNTLRSKLLSGGGVDVGHYSQPCTHLIVDKLVYDDPICVSARSSGKVVVTRSWVDHSFDIGTLIDANSVLYRPLRDMDGIPGSKSLVVCLTGYQRQDREDIMTMVDLMGGQFSKPLVANRVTHLVCYKFEGEKYELAKRMKRIKLVNHRWLEDCLKKWKLLPEVDYEISGYDLEIMEASARDSEDEAGDASLKRANNSPLGLRVGAVAAVEMSKSGGKDIPVVQTNSGAHDGSSFCNTSKDNWLTPRKMDRPLEAMVHTDADAAQQHNYQRASEFQDTSNFASPVLVNKTSEQGMARMETDDSTSINMTIRKHTSLATYSRKTAQRSPETTTLGNESSGQNGTPRVDDRGTKASKLHGESPPLLPQAKFTEGSVSSKGSQKVHQNSEANIPPPASLVLQELRTGLPKEKVRPVLSINDPTKSGEVGHKSPASARNTKLSSSNVVPMEDAMSTVENIISKRAGAEIPETSPTEPTVGNILLQEPRSGSPKQNLRAVPNISDHTEGREVAHKLDLSDSATRLFNSSGVLMEADIWTPKNIALKGALGEIPERSVTEPVMSRTSTSPRSGLTGMKDHLETEQPKKKTAPIKSLGTRGRNKKPINQKGSIYVSEPTPKGECTDSLNKGKVSVPVTDNGNQKEADEEVEITMLEPELNDVPTKDPSDAPLQLAVDKNKRTREVAVGKNSLQSGKKESSSTAEVGKSGVKKMKKSRKEDDAKANDTVMKDIRDNSAKGMENFALENKFGKVRSGGDQSQVAVETLARNEAETKDPSDAAVQLGVDKIKGNHRKEEATVEKNRLQSGGKRSSSTVQFGKPSVKKMKNSKKEDDDAKASDTVLKDIGINSAEVKENVAVDKKSGDVSSDGAQSPVAGKPLARKKAAAKHPISAAMQLEVDKNKGEHGEEATVERSSLQSEKKGSSSTVEVGRSSVKKPRKSAKEPGAKANDTVMKDIGNSSAEGKENMAVDIDSGREQSLVSGKPLARKEAAKSDKTGKKVDKVSKQLSSKPLASRKVLEDQEQEPKFFIVSGPRAQRKEYQQTIRRLKGKCCRDSHQWSYQATHFIAPEIRRTEKFFAAAASGSWILKTDYVADSKEAGKLLPEEPYEWHSSGLSADGAINLESPRKWRLVREKTGHGALYGMRIVVYGDCTIPSLDTLKRAVKAGDGTILATAPPYTRFLNGKTDFALISPGMPCDDLWIQEFIRHEIPCVLSDYIVEYVCKPGYALDKHVLYKTNTWADRSLKKLLQLSVEEEEEEEEEAVEC